MKTFIVLISLAIFGAFVWGMLSLGNLNIEPAPSSSRFLPVPSESVYKDAEISTPDSIKIEDEAEEAADEEAEEDPSDRITPAGASVAPDGSLYYLSQSGSYIVKTSLEGVLEASVVLAEAVKSDVPEASNLTIWRVLFKQSLYDGVQVYGSISDMSQFNVQTENGDSYILNAFGDYEGCPVSSVFDTDFAEEGAVYTQCFIVASADKPNLIYVGSSGSEYNTNPVVFKN